jgi:iron complex transport system substrate-binding protein
MRTPVWTVALAFLLLAGSLLGACSPTPADEALDSPLPPPTAAGSPLTVVDALGRTVEFPAPPQRIVVAGKSSLTIVDTLYLFPEARERLVGLVVGRQDPGAFLSAVDPAFAAKAALEVEAGPEQIAPLDPDVVVLRSFMAESLGQPLDQLGIPVVYVDLETPEQCFRDLGTLGTLLGNGARADEIHAYYQARLDRIEAALADLEDGGLPRVLLLQHSAQGGEVALSVPSASWIQTAEVEMAGGLPAWVEAAPGGGWTVVNLEQIAAWDPDALLIVSYDADPAVVVEDLAADPRWQALRAVEAGRIYGFPGDIFSWDQPDPRWILGVTWLAGQLHPQRLADLDMRAEVVQFFEAMYGMETASIEARILANLKGDVE